MTMDLTTYLTWPWLATLALILLACSAASYWLLKWMRSQINLERQLARISGERISTEQTMKLLERQKGDEIVESVLLRIMPSVLGSTRQNLRRAGLKFGLKLYILALLIVTFVVVQLWNLPNVPAWAQPILIMTAIHFAVDRVILKALVARRQAKIISQLGMLVEHIVRGVQVGQSVDSAMADAEESMEAPLRQEVSTIRRLTEVGVPLVDALQITAAEIDLPEFDFFASAISAQAESGGNLSEALTNLGEVIRQRHQLKLKVEAMTAEGKISALVLAALPVLIFAYLSWTNPDYVEPLYNTTAGTWILYGSFGLIVIGTWVMFRIVKIKV